MIKAEVVFDVGEIKVNGHTILENCQSGDWWVEIDGVQHDKTLEQAIAYCLENGND